MTVRTFLDGRITLLCGDSREMMATLADASVDSIVTDPPYALTSASRNGSPRNNDPETPFGRTKLGGDRGFMGKTWDVGDTAFSAEFWAEAFRVLKPGGHLLAFSGTRTYHRLACAIEDAGFEIRDQIGWAYGCLSDDSDILTESGWRRGVDVKEGERVAAWDAATGAILLQPVERVTIAPFSGDMVRFVNDDTDQLLTPNHRVYHRPRQRQMVNGERSAWYGDVYEVAEAGSINRWNYIKLPMAGLHDGPGIGGIDYAALLGWVWTEGGFDKSPSRGVRIYQSESANAVKVEEIEDLVGRVVPGRKRYDREREYVYGNTVRAYTETCWFFTGDVAERVRADLPDKRPSWDLLWRMSLAEKQAFLDAAMKGDGCDDDFYQKDEESLVWFQALLAMVGKRGKVSMRKAPRDGGGVCITPRDTTELQTRHLKTASQSYEGLVWCVKVPTGAFVARRNGKVFITGNSGFPKSLDVSKAIDKAKGLDREVIRERYTAKRIKPGATVVREGAYGKQDVSFTATDTAPASDEAAEWQGWGTALKPAWEPICVARKPLIGTVAENVQKHGTGAMNIDGCRVESSGRPLRELDAKPTDSSVYVGRTGEGGLGKGLDGGSKAVGTTDVGRWPANVIHDGSDEVLACFPDAPGQQGDVRGTEASRTGMEGTSCYGEYGRVAFGARNDSGSAARFFYTAKANADDRIGSKHPTVKPVDLMQYLVRLVTPKGGLVLDPFAGTGTTGEAAWREGMRAVLIEREAEYQDDIARRMDLATKPAKRAAVAKTKNKIDDHGPLFSGGAQP